MSADGDASPELNAAMVTRRSCVRDVCFGLKALVATCLLADLCARGVTSLAKSEPQREACATLQWPGAWTRLELAASSASGRASKKQAYALLNGAVASLSSSLLQTANGAANRVRGCRVERAEVRGMVMRVVVCLLPMASASRGTRPDCSCFSLPDAESLATAAALVGYPKRMSAGSRRSNRTANRTAVLGSIGVGSALASDACERLERSLPNKS